MNNEEYEKQISYKIQYLKELRKRTCQLAGEIIGKNFFMEDFFFCASADRCTDLIDGFISMLKQRNLTCVGALLRLQMDNCMRSYAAFVAQDKNDVVQCLIDGEKINKKKDNQGKVLSEAHLKNRIAKELDPCFDQVYEKASGYIHLSSKAFYQMLDSVEDGHITFQVGLDLPIRRNPVLIEAADAFIHFVELHQKMLLAVADSKRRTDAELEKEENKVHN